MSSKQQEGNRHGSSGAERICRLSATVQDRGAVTGELNPAAVSERVCVPLLRREGVLPHLLPEHRMHRAHRSGAGRFISAPLISQMPELGDKSAWHPLKRSREAMADFLLSGLMEMGEGFFGGRNPGRGTTRHCAVQSFRERNPDIFSDAGVYDAHIEQAPLRNAMASRPVPV